MKLCFFYYIFSCVHDWTVHIILPLNGQGLYLRSCFFLNLPLYLRGETITGNRLIDKASIIKWTNNYSWESVLYWETWFNLKLSKSIEFQLLNSIYAHNLCSPYTEERVLDFWLHVINLYQTSIYYWGGGGTWENDISLPHLNHVQSMYKFEVSKSKGTFFFQCMKADGLSLRWTKTKHLQASAFTLENNNEHFCINFMD